MFTISSTWNIHGNLNVKYLTILRVVLVYIYSNLGKLEFQRVAWFLSHHIDVETLTLVYVECVHSVAWVWRAKWMCINKITNSTQGFFQYIAHFIYMHLRHVCLLSFTHLSSVLYQEAKCGRTLPLLMEELSKTLYGQS